MDQATTKSVSKAVVEHLASTRGNAAGMPVTGAGVADMANAANGVATNVAIDARTGYEKPVVNLSLDQGGLNEWKSMALANTNAAGTTQVIFGSMLGTAGGAAQFGQPANASDDAAVTSDGVASVGFAQGISRLSNSKPLIVTDLVLDGPEAVINAVTIQYNTLHFDNTVKPEIIPQAVWERRTDFNTTVWHVPGPFVLDPLHFLQLSLVSTVANNFTVRLRFEYWESAAAFSQV